MPFPPPLPRFHLFFKFRPGLASSREPSLCLLIWAKQILHVLLYKPRHLPPSHLPTIHTMLTSVPVSLWTVDFRQWEAHWEFCPVDY